MEKKILKFNLKVLLFIFSIINVHHLSFSNTIIINTNVLWGNINSGSGPLGQPNNNDTLIVCKDRTLTVNVNNATCGKIVLGSGITSKILNANKGNGTLLFNLNGILNVNGTIDRGILLDNIYSGNINMTNGGELSCKGFLEFGSGTFNLISGTGTINLNANNSIPVTFTTFNNLNILMGTTTISTATTIKNIVIDGIFNSVLGNLNIKGDFTNNGIFNPNNGRVLFNGTTTQKISGTNSPTFRDFTINNTAGLTLFVPVNITGNLIMNGGNINSNSVNLLTLGVNSSGDLTWTTGNIVGPFRRWFNPINNSGMGSGLFPVGTATNNYNALFEFTTPPTCLGYYLTLEFIPLNPATTSVSMFGFPLNDGLPSLLNALNSEGYWKAEASTNVDGTYDLSLRVTNFSSIQDFNKTRIINSLDPFVTWGLNGTHNSISGSQLDFTIIRTGLQGFGLFAIANINSPLPVELTYFNATCANDKNINVRWQTASENNSDVFKVERSRDGQSWILLKTVMAAGNSNNIIDYEITDENPIHGLNYYKLIQEDIDGQQKVYDPILAKCEIENTKNSIMVYPNPGFGSMSIDFLNSDYEGSGELYIFDFQGKEIMRKTIDVEKGNNIYNLSNMIEGSGFYLIQIQVDTFKTEVIRYSKL